MKKYIITITTLLLFQIHSIAQKKCRAEQDKFSAMYYLVEGQPIYVISNAGPGSNIEFYSEKFGGKLLAENKTDDIGFFSVKKDKSFRPAFVLNRESIENQKTYTHGYVRFLDHFEFSIEQLEIDEKDKIFIKWDASFGVNSEDYIMDILRSENNQEYRELSQIKPVSNEQTHYVYSDYSALQTENYCYKIRIRSLVNAFTYTSDPLVNVAKSTFKVYPTIVNNILNISAERTANNEVIKSYTITNINGQIIKEASVNNEQFTSIDCSNLSVGDYIINVVSNKNEVLSCKFVKH